MADDDEPTPRELARELNEARDRLNDGIADVERLLAVRGTDSGGITLDDGAVLAWDGVLQRLRWNGSNLRSVSLECRMRAVRELDRLADALGVAR